MNDDKTFQNILWREWRNCRTSDYAQQLFELVADFPVGWGAQVTLMILDGLLGMVLGLLVGFLITTEGAVIFPMITAGGAIGIARGFLAARSLSWRQWLTRLSFGLPTTEPNSRLALAIVGLLLIGVIFSPLVWLIVLGLFWGMSGVLHWMSQGGLNSTQIRTYRAWYGWWRSRPDIPKVEAALKWAKVNDLPKPRPRMSATEALLNPPPPPVEIDFEAMAQFTRNRAAEVEY